MFNYAFENYINSSEVPGSVYADLDEELVKHGYAAQPRGFMAFNFRLRIIPNLLYALCNFSTHVRLVSDHFEDLQKAISYLEEHDYALNENRKTVYTIAVDYLYYVDNKARLAKLCDYNEHLNEELKIKFGIDFFGIMKNTGNYVVIVKKPGNFRIWKLQLMAMVLIINQLKKDNILKLSEELDEMITSIATNPSFTVSCHESEGKNEITRIFAEFSNKTGVFKIDYNERLVNLIIKSAKDRKETLNLEIERYRAQINDLQTRLTDRITTMQQKLLDYNHASNCMDNKQKKADALLHVLTTYQNIHHFTVSNGVVYIYITKDLKINSKSDLQAIMDNLLEECDDLGDKAAVEAMKQLLTDVFINEKYAFKNFACICFEPASNHFSTHQSATFEKGYYPHPHLMKYNCFGTNAPIITECLLEQDYEAAIEQMLYAVGFVNWSDNPVMTHMLSALANEWCDEPYFVDYETNEAISFRTYKERLKNATTE